MIDQPGSEINSASLVKRNYTEGDGPGVTPGEVPATIAAPAVKGVR